MTTIDTATSPVPSTPSIDHTQTLDASLVSVLNMLSGKKYTKAQLKNMKLSEDVLYAGLVYDDLKKQSPDVAKTFSKDLKTLFDKHTAGNEAQPLAKAVQDVLNDGIKAQKLTKSKSDGIVSDAFGHAQLDKTKSALSRTARSGGIDVFAAQVAHDTNATDKTTQKFETAISKTTLLSPTTSRHQRKELDKIFSSLKKAPSTSAPSSGTGESGSPIPNAPTQPSTTNETDTQTPLPSLLNAPTGPNDLVYNPASQKDGNALVMIPLRYANDVNGVSLFDDNGTELSTLSHTGVGDDGRRYFRAQKSGSDMKSAHTMRLQFTDGTDLEFLIGAGDQQFVKEYQAA